MNKVHSASGSLERNASFRQVESSESGPSLTLGTLEYPAYFVNANFELEWWNEAACAAFLGSDQPLSPKISGRQIFSRLLKCEQIRNSLQRDDLLKFHLSIAKSRIGKSTLLSTTKDLASSDYQLLGQLYDDAETIT